MAFNRCGLLPITILHWPCHLRMNTISCKSTIRTFVMLFIFVILLLLRQIYTFDPYQNFTQINLPLGGPIDSKSVALDLTLVSLIEDIIYP